MRRGDGLARTTAVVCVGLALLSAVFWPGRWRVPAGVLGGGMLVGLSAWAIRGVVDGLLGAGPGGGPGEVTGRPSGSWVLVKFFTRHAILALAAYGMMVRLRLDPVGMLAGVSSLVLAAGIDTLRRFQRFP